MHLTSKQRSIIEVIEKGNLDHEGIRYCNADLNQILDRVAYDTSKQSLQFSLRILVEKGVIEKSDRECRRGKSRQTFEVTPLWIKMNAIATSA